MASGRPDWFGTIVAAGKYDTEYKAIELDESGAILALMKGAYDSILKTIAVDENNVMKANLSVQDLDFLTVRPAYGQSRHSSGTKTVPSGTLTDLISINGRGVVYGGTISLTSYATRKESVINISIDYVIMQSWEFEELHNVKVYPGISNPLVLCQYDDNNYNYAVFLPLPLTFETQVKISILQSYGVNQDFDYDIVYALVP